MICDELPNFHQLVCSVGATIRERRIARGMTQAELAAAAGFIGTASTISDIERGRGNLPLVTLARIAWALGCTVGELLPPVPVSKLEVLSTAMDAIEDITRTVRGCILGQGVHCSVNGPDAALRPP